VPRLRGPARRPAAGGGGVLRREGAISRRVQRHRDSAGASPGGRDVLPLLASGYPQGGVGVGGGTATRALLPGIVAGGTEDWDTEYLDLIISLRVVDSLEEAIAHINLHGSGHTDTILTADPGTATQFLDRVDSATVMHNASTRLADGFRF